MQVAASILNDVLRSTAASAWHNKTPDNVMATQHDPPRH
jgi:hypothetical protein